MNTGADGMVMTVGGAATGLPAASGRRHRSRPGRQLFKRILSALLPRRLFMTSAPRRSQSICLTFDDGPHPEHTPRLLDVLREMGVPATFFVIGRNAEAHPDLVRRMVDEGHAVGHHTFDHSQVDRISGREMDAQIGRTDELFARVIGRKVRLFRPPRGQLTAARMLRLWSSGHAIVLWTSDPRDCGRRTSAEVGQWFAANPPEAGAVVLMHDDQFHAARVLPRLVSEARDRGLRFTTPLEWTGNK